MWSTMSWSAMNQCMPIILTAKMLTLRCIKIVAFAQTAEPANENPTVSSEAAEGGPLSGPNWSLKCHSS